ncbi:MAG: phosphopyruvate hydratase [Crenarchaeota archaeon]|nr:phosphopyruvate hydratase [Thermoproteota archaeon]
MGREAYLISAVRARMILDSRGNPTVEVDVLTQGGGFGRAAAPAGASRGKHEAVEVRDGGKEFHGKGVSKAVRNVNEVIGPAIIGMDVRMQRRIDRRMIELDGTPNKSRLGGNAIVATSLAVAKAAACTLGIPLYRYIGGCNARVMPVPMLNIINGGVHAGNELAFQEFMIVPVNAERFSDALRIAVEVYHELKSLLKERYGASAINVGDEGGFAPPMRESREALRALVEAIKRAGYGAGEDVVLAIDAAASQFYSNGVYRVDGREFDTDGLLEYYVELVEEFPIRSIEDPFMEEDFEAFARLRSRIGDRVLIVGDDLYVTNTSRLRKGIEMGSTTAAIVKVNQVGTLSEALDFIEMLHRNGMRAIVSHRSGETEDTTIAHIAVAVNSGLIKTGAPARGERTAKYNELLRIEEDLAGDARFPGINALRPGVWLG